MNKRSACLALLALISCASGEKGAGGEERDGGEQREEDAMTNGFRFSRPRRSCAVSSFFLVAPRGGAAPLSRRPGAQGATFRALLRSSSCRASTCGSLRGERREQGARRRRGSSSSFAASAWLAPPRPRVLFSLSLCPLSLTVLPTTPLNERHSAPPR